MPLAPFFPVLHQVLRPAFPRCLWTGDQQQPDIALTFDDGPHPRHTLELLDVLDYFGVTASFFWLGTCVRRAPEAARAVLERGHWIGLHGYDHRSFPQLNEAELKQSLAQTQSAIAQACNVDPSLIRDVRPPNGLFTPQTLHWLTRWGYRPVMWSVVPEDWVRPGVAVACQRVLRQTRNGSIIVLHDGYCGGEDVSETTAQILPVLLAQNYRFRTIDQLWQQRQARSSDAKIAPRSRP